MKNARQILFIFLLASQTGIAQQIRLNVYSAYVFDDKFSADYDEFTYYKGAIMGGYQWGVGLEYLFIQESSVELTYLRQNSHVPIDYRDGAGNLPVSKNFGFNLNYIMGGIGQHLIIPSVMVETYGSLMAGAVLVNIRDSETNREEGIVRFAWGAKLGCTIRVSKAVGVNLQAEMLSPVRAAGGTFFFGSESGAGLGVYTSIYQFILGGGLTFTLMK